MWSLLRNQWGENAIIRYQQGNKAFLTQKRKAFLFLLIINFFIMEQIGQERFFTMAETYDKMAPILVPNYFFLQDEVFNICHFQKNDEIVVIDLGAGSGIFLEKVLNIYPNAICYWIDYSLDFLKIAQKRLEKYESRVRFLHSVIGSTIHSIL